MGFLSPLFLLAALAVAVPVILHLFHRHRTRRIPFPALRYLRRTEREHARRIRLRQILLLMLRCAAVLLLVLAGARLFVRGRSGSHDPTALAIVLDNSMSSARVLGDHRVLDRLREVALATLDRAGAEDRIWVIRAGEPWDVSVPGDAAAARARVEETRTSQAAGNLSAGLSRARSLVEAAELPAAEIHLVSDLQATALADVRPDDVGDVPVAVWDPPEEDGRNHFIQQVVVGGGLPPMAGQRTEVAVTLEGNGPDTVLVPLRVVIGERIRAAGAGRPGEVVVLPVGPFQPGEVAGWVETDPDDLGIDDRRYFVMDVRPPVRVARTGAA
ncbi:MAG TPA: BatA and WFA domain-containing protein, partial [Longimicrobiales bacterium]|nr:BatA and WFA domain-containing protein [Longimicrobiales bacterium]